MFIKIARLHVIGAPKRYIVDRRALRYLRRYTWRFVPRHNRAWATVRRKALRVMLHKFITHKEGKNWQEVFFANNDPFDCRFGNLRPYDRVDDGARRKRFKNNKSGFKGVHFKRTSKSNKWGASIRVRGRLKHLGYFPTAEAAAQEYTKAYKLAHPR